MRQFLLDLVLSAALIAIAAYSFFAGDITWIALAVGVPAGLAALTAIWLMATRKRRREKRDREREEAFLRKQLGDPRNTE